jgi:hydrogenase maturation protein HypF
VAAVNGHDEHSGLRLSITGVVQGVGFRPTVYTLARRNGLTGWVRNTSGGVEIYLEGRRGALQRFAEQLPLEAPSRSHIATIDIVPVDPRGDTDFLILESAPDPNAYQLISPDIATCDACRAELLDPSNRRYQYPFINCTDCGPRFTIIEDLPYDRVRTTMRHFPLCPLCRREYEDPYDRRFHAEPNACPVCGPRLMLMRLLPGEAPFVDGVPRPEAVHVMAEGTTAEPARPVTAAVELLLAGSVVALKGLGGFHLACDATNGEAVRSLKARKRRPHKPLAVMFADLEELRRHCVVSPAEAELLESPEHPIVLVEWRSRRGGGEDEQTQDLGPLPPVHEEVAPRQLFLGAMLPYTPLHILLLRAAGRPRVKTSGNLAEEPIVSDWSEIERLAPVADAFLVHNRAIAARCDDSVALVAADGQPRLLRRARGYAPLPVPLPRRLPQILACGAELKSAFCLTRGFDAFLSQHIGDLENIETLEHFETMLEWYQRLFRIHPETIAYDLHPEYLSTKFALRLPQPEKVAVQHHHAHVAARMAEHGHERLTIGVSMDGLGYGHDGRLWGGEILVCDLQGYRRVAHFEELPLPGGATAIKTPWRVAAGWVYKLLGEDGLARAARQLRIGAAILGEPAPTDGQLTVVRQQIDWGVNVPATTSCGRLFDAVSALAGIRQSVTYEGQAAVELEMAATQSAADEPYRLPIEGDMGAAARGRLRGAESWAAAHAAGETDGARPAIFRLAPLMSSVLDDLEAGRSAAEIGARLHITLAALVVESCRRIRAEMGLRTVALVGGVFQNRLLSELCEAGLRTDGFDVLAPRLVPTNDGGIALGQAVVAGYTVLDRRGLRAPGSQEEV